MSLEASSSIADINIEKSVGQYAPMLDTVCYSKCIQYLSSIPDVLHHSGMHTFYDGYELFGASIFPQQLPQSSLSTVSNAFVKSTNTVYRGRSCSMYFSWSCCRQKIMSTVLRFERMPHCVSGTTSGVMWFESLFSRIRAKILPAAERRDLPR